ncbi:hypothetical protein UAJ10_02955 [Nitrospirillum sp. BR 11164]|uniref:hypothetical protein n=1 Tax=Nitrospirillum sp. BR 11164 TaxID=3104324 RepID=UPI002AFEEC3E|nr:hypothetical protein [Nitrospirillum sp. BR 11164]MEA1647977.1 hypothetical protein [Nitrospirillum sp. BR 11164]
MSISSIGGYASSAALYRPAAPAATADTTASQAAPQQPVTLDRDGDGDVDTGSVDKDRGNNIKA